MAYVITADNPGSSVAVGTTSTLVTGESHDREEIALVNDSDTTIYLRLAADGAVAGQGIRLNANGGSYTTTNYAGPICAIHSGTGSKNLTVVEV